MKNPSSSVALLRYLYRQRKGDVGKKNEVLGVAFGLNRGRSLLVGDHVSDALALSARKGRTGAGVRHIVISAEGEGRDVVEKLKLAAADWIAKYARGRCWVAIVHASERGHPHVHLVTESKGDDKKGLKWSRQDVRGMCAMSFTQHFEGNKPTIQRGRKSKIYPHAQDLDVLDLVRTIINSGMSVDAYLDATAIGCGKKDRNGKFYGVIYRGRRIRIATLRSIYAMEGKRRQQERDAAELIVSKAISFNLRAGGLLMQLDDVTNSTNPTKGISR
jgi:hypothetical protein